jgi:ABC-type multidrug transport system fused ATPase/permease subunit
MSRRTPSVIAGTRSLFRVFGDYVRPHRTGLVVGGLMLVASSALGLIQPLAAKGVIDALATGAGLTAALVLLSVLVVAAAALLGGGDFLVLRAAEGVTLAGRRGLVRHILRLTVPAMRTQQPGDLLARVAGDTSVLRQVASQAIIQLLTGVVMLAGALVLMATVDLVLLLWTLAVVVVLGGLVAAIMPRIRASALRAQQSVGSLAAAFEPALGAFTTVKASGTEDTEMARIDAESTRAYRQGIQLATWGSIAGTLAGLAIQIAFLVVLGVGGARVASGAMAVSSLVAFLLYVAYLTAPLMQMVTAGTYLQAARAAVTRITEITALPTEAIAVRTGGTRPVSRPAKRRGAARLCFEDVTFTYPGRDEPALHGVSMEIAPGTMTAVVGSSGSGKTTLLSLIERFYEPESGRILLDGEDVAGLDLAGLRGDIGYVEQESPVLGGTLRENLAYAAPDATEAELRAVIHTTRLDELFHRLGEDLDAPILHRGVSLSGGERQRVAIARSLLRAPRLLMLDEVTSQLDSVNEAALRDAMAAVLAQGTTVVVVAHRLSTIRSADRIVVLQDGVVAATGTHGDLVRADGLYAQLASEQLAG